MGAIVDLFKKDTSPRLIEISKQGGYVLKKNKKHFKTNWIRTTKYTWYNFLIKNLFEQFYYRNANLYFLLISILCLIPKLSPVGSFGAIVALVVVVLVQMFKDFIEDLFRFFSDREINNKKTKVLRNNTWVKDSWQNIQAGDIIWVENKDPLPADILVLFSSEKSGSLFVETSSLDGETDLKYKRVPDGVFDMITKETDVHDLSCLITCDAPNTDLFLFNGHIDISEKSFPISNESLLLRGSSLRNTDYIIGAAVYTGHETKLLKNRSVPPIKKSQIDIFVNRYILGLFVFHFCICLACTITYGIWSRFTFLENWYLGYDKNYLASGQLTQTTFIAFFTYYILISWMIPLSLYVTLEGAKLFQGRFISNDMKMYDEKYDVKCQVKNSSLNEDLGQVRFIFTDKTGTLTQNEMKFFKCSIGGVTYGTGVTEISKTLALRKGKVLVEDADHKDFYDDRISNGAWKKEKNSQEIEEFFKLLALCHTVIVEENKETGKTTLSASSPDEEAILNGIKLLGIEFISRDLKKMKIKVNDKEEEYEILDTLEFTSDRKRMSVILKNSDGKIFLYIKGADSVIFSLAKSNPDLERLTNEHLEQFGEEGLRTLVVGKVEISEKDYEEFHIAYMEAKKLLDPNEKQKKIAKLCETVEKDIEVLGATALEDKLQDGVPFCLKEFKKAGIRVWMLTGDKLDTAQNIGFACNIINDEMEIFKLQDSLYNTKEKIFQALKEFRERKTEKKALLIEGKVSLATVLSDDELKEDFVEFALECQSIICCRVSPKQKGDVVALVQGNIGKDEITLAIGDGGNDVSMLQVARIGIGISGREGNQAANAADYSFGQFRFLKRLLFVHGRWCYRRGSRIVLYSFYKNTLLNIGSLFYIFYCGFSGASVHDRWTQSFWNLIFTAWPIAIIGIFDRDIDEDRAEDFPHLYKQGHENRYLTFPIFLVYFFNSFFHSCCIVLIQMYSFEHLSLGYDLDIITFGVGIYTTTLVVSVLKALLETGSFTIINLLAAIFSLGTWFSFIFVYGSLYYIIIDPNWRDVLDVYRIFYLPVYWITLIATLGVTLMRDFTWKAYRRMVSQELYYSALSSGKNIDREVIKDGFPIEEGMPIFKESKAQKQVKKLVKKSKKQIVPYLGFAFSQSEESLENLEKSINHSK